MSNQIFGSTQISAAGAVANNDAIVDFLTKVALNYNKINSDTVKVRQDAALAEADAQKAATKKQAAGNRAKGLGDIAGGGLGCAGGLGSVYTISKDPLPKADMDKLNLARKMDAELVNPTTDIKPAISKNGNEGVFERSDTADGKINIRASSVDDGALDGLDGTFMQNPELSAQTTEIKSGKALEPNFKDGTAKLVNGELSVETSDVLNEIKKSPEAIKAARDNINLPKLEEDYKIAMEKSTEYSRSINSMGQSLGSVASGSGGCVQASRMEEQAEQERMKIIYELLASGLGTLQQSFRQAFNDVSAAVNDFAKIPAKIAAAAHA